MLLLLLLLLEDETKRIGDDLNSDEAFVLVKPNRERRNIVRDDL